jgi:DNA gyrase subunit A
VILREGDELIAAKLTSGNDDIILAKRKGKAIRFGEKDVRDMGRSTQGVTGVKLDKDDKVVAMVVVKRGGELVAVTEHGYGKRTRIGDFRNIKRGGKGVVAISTDARNGDLVAVKEVIEEDEVMIITRNGIIIRTPVNSISILGRPAKGVKLISLAEGDAVVDVTLMAGEKISEGEIAEGDEGEEMDGEETGDEEAEEAEEETGEPTGDEPEEK